MEVDKTARAYKDKNIRVRFLDMENNKRPIPIYDSGHRKDSLSKKALWFVPKRESYQLRCKIAYKGIQYDVAIFLKKDKVLEGEAVDTEAESED